MARWTAGTAIEQKAKDLPQQNYRVIGNPVTHSNGITRTPVGFFVGYHGVGGEWEWYKGILDGVRRPFGSGGQGNGDPEWQGWYLAESPEHAAGYAVSDEDESAGTIARYEFASDTVVHTVPLSLAGADGSFDVAVLHRHFGVPDGVALLDWVGQRNGTLRLPDVNAGGYEVIVPWGMAPLGVARHYGWNDPMSQTVIEGDKPPRRHPWTASWARHMDAVLGDTAIVDDWMRLSALRVGRRSDVLQHLDEAVHGWVHGSRKVPGDLVSCK